MPINSAETVVADALRGMAAAHPEPDVDVERRIVVRRDARTGGRVGLVSGGGSGHEPPHAGFVGYGMAAAARPGEVMGATPLLELYGFHAEVARLPAARGAPVARAPVGNYVTSLDMAGCSVTLRRADEELLRLWDAPVRTAAPRWGR